MPASPCRWSVALPGDDQFGLAFEIGIVGPVDFFAELGLLNRRIARQREDAKQVSVISACERYLSAVIFLPGRPGCGRPGP